MFKTNQNKKNKLYVAKKKSFYNNNVVNIKPVIQEPVMQEPVIEQHVILEEHVIQEAVPVPAIKLVIEEPIVEPKLSVREMVENIEKKQDTTIDMSKVPDDVKKTLNKLLFVSRYKKL